MSPWLAPELDRDPTHEGYAAGQLPAGDLTGPNPDPAEITGYLPACSCGWRGRTGQSPTPAGQDAVHHIWRGHIRDVIAERAQTRDGLVTLLQQLAIRTARLDTTTDTAEDRAFVRQTLAHGAELAAKLWPTP